MRVERKSPDLVTLEVSKEEARLIGKTWRVVDGAVSVDLPLALAADLLGQLRRAAFDAAEAPELVGLQEAREARHCAIHGGLPR